MSDLSYAKQKLFEAVSALVGAGTIQERLTYACVPLLVLSQPAPEMAADLREKLNAIVARLTATPLSSSTAHLPRELSDEEGGAIAKQIVELFVAVSGGL